MIRLEEFNQPRDGTRWRGKRVGLRSSAIHPYPGELYYGRGPDRVAGYRWFEYEGGAVCLWEDELEPVERGVIMDPYPDILIQVESDRLVAKARREPVGGFRNPEEAPSPKFEWGCWVMVLNGDEVDSIALRPEEPREDTERRVRAWLDARRARQRRGPP